MADDQRDRLRAAYETAVRIGNGPMFVDPPTGASADVRISDVGVPCIRVCDRLGRLWLLPMEPNPSLEPDGWPGHRLELRACIDLYGPLVVTGRA